MANHVGRVSDTCVVPTLQWHVDQPLAMRWQTKLLLDTVGRDCTEHQVHRTWCPNDGMGCGRQGGEGKGRRYFADCRTAPLANNLTGTMTCGVVQTRVSSKGRSCCGRGMFAR